jgi:hypothetical protein
MSNKEKAINIINEIPEYKLVYVIEVLNGIKNMLNDVEEIDPDEWDLKMIADAEKINDGTTITLEDLAKELKLNV